MLQLPVTQVIIHLLMLGSSFVTLRSPEATSKRLGKRSCCFFEGAVRLDEMDSVYIWSVVVLIEMHGPWVVCLLSSKSWLPIHRGVCCETVLGSPWRLGVLCRCCLGPRMHRHPPSNGFWSIVSNLFEVLCHRFGYNSKAFTFLKSE